MGMSTRLSLAKLVILAIFILVVRFYLVEPMVVHGQSMHPTLRHGDLIFVEKISYLMRKPAPGEIVVGVTPEEKTLLVKRVVQVVPADDQVGDAEGGANQEGVLVIGDNRNHSYDSRRFGSIPLKDIRGRVWLLIRSRKGLENTETVNIDADGAGSVLQPGY